MARRFFILANAAILILSACGQPDNFQGIPVSMMEKSPGTDEKEAHKIAREEAMNGLMDMTAVDPNAPQQSAPPPPVPPAVIAKKIIKTGKVSYAVKDYKASRKEIAGIIAGNGGYIVGENERRTDESWLTRMEIKVPSDKFDACLEALSGNAETLNEKNVTAQDVTEEYVDVASRMKAKKEVEQRYLEILKQAKTVEDILKVEEQLQTIREEVEASQGRLRYIDHNVSMSTIHLTFYQTLSNTSPQGPGFFSRAFLSIKDGWNGALGVFIALVSFWPLWVLAIVVFIALRRYTKRRKLRVVTEQAN